MKFNIYLILIHQVSDKRLLRTCGNGKSFLVETGTFQPNLRDGTQKEPKFELDSLEINVQSIIGRTPDVLLILSHQAGDKNDFGRKYQTAQFKG
ncbi:hypothetical protein [Maribellus maritimus]|uniref:hypothetical protein n=1 Tax=Maribellus maritimus TaxID=2870838 RepID=UPI001EE9BD6C|nr:hypothetical protein [Maribellus maritimus]MCG6189721.1 hypothetical protein [Maribellus maritimus]